MYSVTAGAIGRLTPVKQARSTEGTRAAAGRHEHRPALLRRTNLPQVNIAPRHRRTLVHK
jgi:hypothetical protein